MNDFELGWFTGIIEGEGSMFLDTNGARTGRGIIPCIVVAMTDKDTIEQVTALAGCGKMYGPYLGKGHIRPIWRWRCRNHDDSLALLQMMRPHLSVRRGQQADKLI